MAGRWKLLILALHLPVIVALTEPECGKGFIHEKKECIDEDECAVDEDYPDKVGPCGENATCHNTVGSFYCQCADGLRSTSGNVTFSADTASTCKDINECLEINGICGPNASCHNTIRYYSCICDEGFISTTGKETFRHGDNITCRDIDECEEEGLCGLNAACINTQSSYHCVCNVGFGLKSGKSKFSGNQEQCEDICMIDKTICGNGTCHRGAGGHYCACHAGFTNYGNKGSRCTDIDECKEEGLCGLNAACINTQSSYHCVCNVGFGLKSGKSKFSGNQEQCEDICMVDKTICGNGTCHRGAGGHYCACHAGFTNYGNKGSRCTELNCDVFKDKDNLPKHVAHDLVMQLWKKCVELTESENSTKLDGKDILKRLLSVIDKLLSSEALNDNRKVSTFLDLVESILKLIGPSIDPPGTNTSSTHTELKLLVDKSADLPQGAVTLSTRQARLDIQLETAAGDPSYYPGFTTVSLLSYSNLENSTDGFFSGLKPQAKESFKINSKVVTVTVSNGDTRHLKEPVRLTFYHLKQANESNHTCVFWDSSMEGGGSWSARDCSVVESKPNYTVCSCTHLSSFAVLMALYEIEDKLELQLITYVGLSLSLICLFICILTFSLIRSIKSPRTTIHLHLCISLFIATALFLVGISRTESRVGCAVVAGLLHFFFLAAFCWMCLEGIQLFRMVVLVFNTSFKTLYMMAGGYGVPAVIVAISALANAKGYGTERHCWLNLDIIWSFFGPVCVIIIVNIVFFLITVWKLAQKFSSLNPDLDNLQKIKAFTITAVAQLCLLGTMWIFGCFQFEEGTIVSSYLFTIFGSFQGVMLFVMHCLFPKQVRDEYGNILNRFCAPRKKNYAGFSSSHTSEAKASKSTHDTGESRI